MKTSKIASCTFDKSFTSKFGTLYQHTITLENGDTGQINAKESLPLFLSTGETIWYELIPNGKYPSKIKRMQAPDGAQPQKDYNTTTDLVVDLMKEIANLKEVVKQLVKHTKLVYVAPKPKQEPPQGKINGEMARQEAESIYDNTDLPF